MNLLKDFGNIFRTTLINENYDKFNLKSFSKMSQGIIDQHLKKYNLNTFIMKKDFMIAVAHLTTLKLFIELGQKYEQKIKFKEDLQNVKLANIDSSVLLDTTQKNVIDTYNELLRFSFKSENLKLAIDFFFENDNKTPEVFMTDVFKKHYLVNMFRIQEDQNIKETTEIDIVTRKNKQVNKEFLFDVLMAIGLSSNQIKEVHDVLQNGQKRAYGGIHDKLEALIQNNIVSPIVSDFLLYSKKSDNIKKYGQTGKDIIALVNNVRNGGLQELSQHQNISNPILKQRQAIEIDIINQVKSMSKFLGSDNLSLYKQMVEIWYPYVNFNSVANSIKYTPKNTTVVVRDITFNQEQQKKRYIQTRTVTSNDYCDMVGLLIYNGKNRFAVLCEDASEVKQFDEKSKKSILHGAYYYFFDKNQPIEDQINEIFDQYLEKSFKKLSQYLQNNIVSFQRQKTLVDSSSFDEERLFDLYQLIIEQKSHLFDETEYDIFEDFFYGFKQGSKPNKELQQLFDVNIETFKNEFQMKSLKYDVVNAQKESFGGSIKLPPLKVDNYDEFQQTAICQHFIDIENIDEIVLKNPLKYQESINEFINKYIVYNQTQSICKSCGFNINGFEKYNDNGSFDDEGNYISHTITIPQQLHQIKEYQHLHDTLIGIDRLVEKVAQICNSKGFIGQEYSVINNRKNIVKNIVDIIEHINQKYGKNAKETRHQKFMERHGLQANISHFFVFPLDNDIYKFSSKSKDLYKQNKFNNIIAYTILQMIVQMNGNQVAYLKNDLKGTCSYEEFRKSAKNVFGNINVPYNNKNNTKPILQYPLLCYQIYILACFINKFNIWLNINNDENNKIIFQNIVQTTCHLLMVLMTQSGEKPFCIKQFQQQVYTHQQGLFVNKNIISQIIANVKNIADSSKKIEKFQQAKNKELYESAIPVPKVFEHMELAKNKYDQNYFAYNWNAKTVIPRLADRQVFNTGLNSANYCVDGNVHKWFVNKNVKNTKFDKYKKHFIQEQFFVCKLCGVSIFESAKKSKELEKNNEILNLKNLLKSVCKISKMYDVQSVKKYCNQKNVSDNDLLTMKNNINKLKIQQQNLQFELTDKQYATCRKNIKLINDNFANFFKQSKSGDIFDDFLLKVSQITKKPLTIFKNNTFQINFDYKLNKLQIPLIVSENTMKLQLDFKEFGKDVLYYQHSGITMYFDAKTLQYIGYLAKGNKIYYISKPHFMQYQTSFKDQILSLGVQFVDKKYKHLFEKVVRNKDYSYFIKHDDKSFVADKSTNPWLSNNYQMNLKVIIMDFVQLVNKIYNSKYIGAPKLQSNMKNSEISDQNDVLKPKIYHMYLEFKDKMIDFQNVDSQFLKEITTIPFSEKNDLQLMFSLFNKYVMDLLEKNTEENNFNFIQMIIEFVNHYFQQYNVQRLLQTAESSKFLYQLNSNVYKIKEQKIDDEHEITINDIYNEEDEEDINNPYDIEDTAEGIDYESIYDKGNF